MFFSDGVTVAGARRTRDGYMVADCRIAKAGNIQLYRGAEMGRPEMASVRVYRDAAAVFDNASMSAWAFKPVTLSHPPSSVSAANWRDHAVGLTGGEITRDGETIRVPLVLMDADAIQAVEDGTRELSCGYGVVLDWEPGTTPAGEGYDARVTQIIPNHVAVVAKGRAGSECRIGDGYDRATLELDGKEMGKAIAASLYRAVSPTPEPSHQSRKGSHQMADENTRAVVLDGLTIRTNDQGAEAITRLQRQMADAAEARSAHDAEHRRTVDALNGQIEALRAEATRAAEVHRGEADGLRATHQQALDALRAELDAALAQTTDAALDARVTARAALIAQARRHLGDAYDPTGRSDTQVQRDVVARALPTVTIGDAASTDYVRALFDAAMATKPADAPRPTQPDPLRVALITNPPIQTGDADPIAAERAAFAKLNVRDTNAWKNPSPEAA